MAIFHVIVLSVTFVSLLPFGHSWAYTCPAPAPQAPCPQGPEPGVHLGWGNPVHVLTGEKWQHELDLPAHPQWPGISRYYLSRPRPPGPSLRSPHWALSYDVQLQNLAGQFRLIMPDGSQHALPDKAVEKLAASAHPAYWRWQVPDDGGSLDFNQAGWMIRQAYAGQTPVTIIRHAADSPWPHAIEHLYHRPEYRLTLHYDSQQQLQHLDTPAGRFSLTYDDRQRLSSVLRPDGMRRQYGYQDHEQWALLSSIGIATGAKQLPLQQWQYHPDGSVIAGQSGTQAAWQLQRQAGYSRLTQGEHEHRWNLNSTGQLHRQSIQLCPSCPVYGNELQYNDKRLLSQVSGWQLARDAQDKVRRLSASQSGWGPLELTFASDGRLQSWHSASAQLQIQHDHKNRPVLLDYGGHSRVHLSYGTGGLTQIDYQHQDQHSQVTLHWSAAYRLSITSEHETQHVSLDATHQQIRQRHVFRPVHQLKYQERFDYDAQHRLTRHTLPEGGQLDYRWGQGQQLLDIVWQDAQGQRHVLIQHMPGRAGYRYGNQLQLLSEMNAQAKAYRVTLFQGHIPLWEQKRLYLPDGQVAAQHHWHIDPAYRRSHYYAYNEQAQLIVEQQGTQQHWKQWDASGRLVASNTQKQALVPAMDLPTQLGEKTLQYGANRRLQTVAQAGQLLGTYLHDAFGQRIHKHSAQGTQGYLYHERQLLAEYDASADHSQGIELQRRYVYAHHVPVAMLLYTPEGQTHIYAIHSDLSGAARLVSDAQGNIVWQADYSAWGQAQIQLAKISFALRLPGQYFDAETGWHDNLLRTYLPEHGQYLEADPLGPVPGSQAVGYARQQPLRYIDPWGLILFAFDGTRMSEQTHSNVWKLAQLYAQGPSHYQPGPGSAHYMEWNALTAWNARQIVENHWQSLLNAIENTQKTQARLQIDILGFSRGAALAREFANRVLEHTQAGLFNLDDPRRGLLRACVDLRFMGLFDTVAQFGLLGSHNYLYRLGVAQDWQWVAHAVALHEHRHLFPLSAIQDALNVVQAPFVGAHSDIGGGVLIDQLSVNDLDKVALAWMHWQAKAAGLDLKALSGSDQTIEQAILTDPRPAFLRYLQNGDRQINYHGHGQDLQYQDAHPRLGHTTRAQVETLIQRYTDWRSSSEQAVGEVDLTAYKLWLEHTLGWSP